MEDTWRDIVDRARMKVRELQPAQFPVVNDVLALNDVPFTKTNLPAPPYHLAWPEGLELRVAAGRLQGLRDGMKFNLYAPGAKKFDVPGTEVGQVQLTEIQLNDAKGRVISGQSLPAGVRLPALPPEQATGKPRVYVALNEAVPATNNLKAALQSNPAAFEVIESPETADFTVEASPGMNESLATVVLKYRSKTIWTLHAIQPSLTEHLSQRILEFKDIEADPNSRQVIISRIPQLPSRIHAMFVGIDRYKQQEFRFAAL